MYKLLEAKLVASDFMKTIDPFCEKQLLVGSILRNCQMVNDIDVCVIAKYIDDENSEELFGKPTPINTLERQLTDMCFKDELEYDLLKKSDGEKKKRFTQFKGSPIPIDVYFCNEKTWATTCLIRTGSKNHNIKLCMRAQSMHITLKADGSGLLSPSGTLIEIHSELEIFNLLKLPFVPPERR
ncbi:MAG: hypothetical protein IMZ53_12760 [Thermoplasmata archaeon]|nr:hypothetical protein [Thermoplasmata archaeon]